MAHELLRIKSKLQNTPHLIDANTFSEVMEYLNTRNMGGDIQDPELRSGDGGGANFADSYNPDTKTGVMYIEGPLSYKPVTMFGFDCGGTNYMGLKEQMEYLVSVGAKTVAIIADSGGGEAHGMMDTANYIRALADQNGIKILTYVDGTSASACYGLACISDEIITSSDSMVGSIGVLIQLMNDSKALEKEGYERTFITAGEDKVPFDKDGGFTEAFTDRLQYQVDTLYDSFTSHVAAHRGMTQEAVIGTKADVFLAKDALNLGLIDSIMTVEEFYTHLADVAQGVPTTTSAKPFKFENQEDTVNMEEITKLQEALANKEAELSALTSLFEEQGAKLEALSEVFAEAEAAKALAKTEQRRTMLSAVLPADKVDAKLTAFESLDDSSFSEIVETLQAAKDSVAAGTMMNDIGGDGAELPEPKNEGAHQTTAQRIAARLAAGK